MSRLFKVAVLACLLSSGLALEASGQTLVGCPGGDDIAGGLLAPSGKAYTVPTADERHDIEDFISRYAWLMDSQAAQELPVLFDDNVQYLQCVTGQEDVQKRFSKGELLTQFKAAFAALAKGGLRARRLFSNIMIRKADDGSFDAIISSIVFLQSLTSATSPQPDYMASIYATIVPANDPSGSTKYRFKIFLLISDPFGSVIFAR